MRRGRASRNTGMFTIHHCTGVLRFIIASPSRDFLFGTPALSPDMQVICVTLDVFQ
jgi:hypothetical protein